MILLIRWFDLADSIIWSYWFDDLIILIRWFDLWFDDLILLIRWFYHTDSMRWFDSVDSMICSYWFDDLIELIRWFDLLIRLFLGCQQTSRRPARLRPPQKAKVRIDLSIDFNLLWSSHFYYFIKVYFSFLNWPIKLHLIIIKNYWLKLKINKTLIQIFPSSPCKSLVRRQLWSEYLLGPVINWFSQHRIN